MLQNGLLRYIFTHVQTCDATRIQVLRNDVRTLLAQTPFGSGSSSEKGNTPCPILLMSQAMTDKITRDLAVEGQSAFMNGQDLHVDVPVLVLEHNDAPTSSTLLKLSQASESGHGRLHLCAGVYPV